ncbi:hypothetical protein [Streptomyces sp. RKAG337]|uniref:hypothetical protein n=1 Tax=Streptomyces sp. RKAG337 TaxID=2893404 RepID=UPI002033804F|nr:hypothetical protein [Streptomyces sp. RKAG337]MCM2427358.1 hypothetical protein [Streptomyces sp. RKAG337]
MTAETLFDTAPAIPAPAPAGAGPRPLVIGLDLSLTCTGVAGAEWTEHIKTTAKGHLRLAYILEQIATYIRAADLVVIEGPSFGGGVKHRHEDLAGLRVMTRHLCWTKGIDYAVMPPSCRALYAAGKGNASKGEVRTAITERYGMQLEGRARYDEADAYALCAAGLDWLGYPLAPVPEKNATALTGSQWPDRKAVAL